MAIVGGIDDENDPSKPQASDGGGGYVNGSGGQGATTKAAPTSSGSYTNLTSYLGANEQAGATTGQAAGNTVNQSGVASNAANKVLGDNGAKEAATGAVGIDQKTVAALGKGAKIDPKKMAAINAGIGTGQNATYTGGHQVADAYQGKVPTVQYGGPKEAKNVTGYGDADSAMQMLGGNMGNFTGGQDKRTALLQQTYQQPSYTQGESNLDSFLVGGTTGGKQAIASAKKSWDGQDKAYQGVKDAVSGNIDKAKQKTKDTQDLYTKVAKNAAGQTAKVQSAYDQAEQAALAKTQVNSDAWRPPTTPKAAAATKAPATPAVVPTATPIGTANVDLNHEGDPTPIRERGPQDVDPNSIDAANANDPSILWAAHGGQVPSYAELMKMLGSK